MGQPGPFHGPFLGKPLHNLGLVDSTMNKFKLQPRPQTKKGLLPRPKFVNWMGWTASD